MVVVTSVALVFMAQSIFHCHTGHHSVPFSCRVCTNCPPSSNHTVLDGDIVGCNGCDGNSKDAVTDDVFAKIHAYTTALAIQEAARNTLREAAGRDWRRESCKPAVPAL